MYNIFFFFFFVNYEQLTDTNLVECSINNMLRRTLLAFFPT